MSVSFWPNLLLCSRRMALAGAPRLRLKLKLGHVDRPYAGTNHPAAAIRTSKSNMLDIKAGLAPSPAARTIQASSYPRARRQTCLLNSASPLGENCPLCRDDPTQICWESR